MLALIIIAAILLLLLLSPASVEACYREGGADVVARYLVFRVDLLKKRPPKKKKEPAPEEKAPEKEEAPKKKENKLAMVWQLLKASRRGLRIFRRHLVFSRVRIFLRVGGEDAHQAAEAALEVNLAVLAALDVIALAFVLRRPETAVAPDFLAPGLRADIRLRVGIRPLFVMLAAASVIWRYLRLQKETRTNQRIKGGKQHARTESAASHQ